eukprot:TRINITY_DN10102_c0_g1_i2.p1 TRINITY_DN10102_c0_g1~~TRINITY_DN10102_c0_g1_i2.p1  ORF type:complete len:739 (-),score=128.66 TRINITY_DN10102_c0_g1_i2:134-2233(-)
MVRNGVIDEEEDAVGEETIGVSLSQLHSEGVEPFVVGSVPLARTADTQGHLNDLDQQVRNREDELNQLRADYAARVQRSADLQAAVDARRAVLARGTETLDAALASISADVQDGGRTLCRQRMAGEDSIARGRRMTAARDEEIRFLEKRVQEEKEGYLRALHAKGPVSTSVVEEVLQERARQIVALKTNVTSQEEALRRLNADLRRILDFMMRVNIEAAGGPAYDLGKEDFLPGDVLDQLNLSPNGQGCVKGLVKKYEVCMAECQTGAMPPASAEGLRFSIGESDFLTDAFSQNVGGVPHSEPHSLPRRSSGPSRVTVKRGSSASEVPVAGLSAAPLTLLAPQNASRVHQPYRCIQAVGAHSPIQRGFLSSAARMLRTPIRDAADFARQRKCQAVSRLAAVEKDLGVWSDFATNHTAGGLRPTLDATRPVVAPTRPGGNKQAVVLTCERLFLFDALTWVTALEVKLADIEELVVSAFSNTVLLLRLQRRPDIIIDLEERDRLVDEIRLAAARKSRGAQGEPTFARVCPTAEPLVPLLDEYRERAGTIVYVEQNIFLLLRFAPDSFLLVGEETLFVGFLEMQLGGYPRPASAQSGWHLYFFLLKGGPTKSQRLVAWCHHPNDQRPAGWISADAISGVHAVESTDGHHCLAIERRSDMGSHEAVYSGGASTAGTSLMIRASSSKSREDWLVAINMVCGGTC